MNYDPIHDTYSAPEHSSPHHPDPATPNNHGPKALNEDESAQKGLSASNTTSPLHQRNSATSNSPIGNSSTVQAESTASSSAPHPKREDVPYKPFSIDSLMGGAEPEPANESVVFSNPAPPAPVQHVSPAPVAPPSALIPQNLESHQPTAQTSPPQKLEPQNEVQKAPSPPEVAKTEPPAPENAGSELPQMQTFHTDPALLSQGPENPPYSPENKELPPDFRDISRGYKYLKKSDGEPFWRKDIQYDFLHEVFSDETRCFTNYFPYCEVTNAANEPKLTFAELYVRTLAESNKLSKILRERLIKEKDMGIAVSKVCLLVNTGRMNTTVNFVPDMRSALRTYHSIPSLQTTGSGDSRPLQDTPRLKTILKAVCDDQKHLLTLLDLFKNRNDRKPNTNVIKLIFLMSTFFQNIPFHYDDSYEHDSFLEKFRFIKASPGPQNKFMEFFLNDEIHPKCRSKRFLWLMYTYLETSFTAGEIANNPFNPHVIPPLEYIPESELLKHDADTDYEIEYAIQMYHTRMMHLSTDAHNPLPKKGNKSRRERQKILSQINDGSGQSPASFAEDGDDLMNADETTLNSHEDLPQAVKPEPMVEKVDPIVTSLANAVVNTTPTPQSQEKPSQEKAHKRKRPAPSVGSLVEDTRKPVLDEESQKLTTPDFPIEGLQDILDTFTTSTPSSLYKPLTKDGTLSADHRKKVLAKLKKVIDQVSKTIPRKFEATKEALLRWIEQYFRYRASVGSGLLGIEWEDIRSDVSNGVETHLYQQLGKQLLIQKYERNRDDEEYDVERSFATQSQKLGDMATIDIGEIEKPGSGFEPKRDYNKLNERTQFELQIMELLSATIAKKKAKRLKLSRVSFDLEKGSVSFK